MKFAMTGENGMCVLRSKLFVCLLAVGFCVEVLASGVGASLPSPDEALENLKSGSIRFASGKSVHPRATASRLKETFSDGQHPFSTVITCSDSRVPVERIFDQGIGDVFVIRVAGNVCDVDEIGSIEYEVDHLGTPVLVILGHRNCGAGRRSG